MASGGFDCAKALLQVSKGCYIKLRRFEDELQYVEVENRSHNQNERIWYAPHIKKSEVKLSNGPVSRPSAVSPCLKATVRSKVKKNVTFYEQQISENSNVEEAGLTSKLQKQVRFNDGEQQTRNDAHVEENAFDEQQMSENSNVEEAGLTSKLQKQVRFNDGEQQTRNDAHVEENACDEKIPDKVTSETCDLPTASSAQDWNITGTDNSLSSVSKNEVESLPSRGSFHAGSYPVTWQLAEESKVGKIRVRKTTDLLSSSRRPKNWYLPSENEKSEPKKWYILHTKKKNALSITLKTSVTKPAKESQRGLPIPVIQFSKSANEDDNLNIVQLDRESVDTKEVELIPLDSSRVQDEISSNKSQENQLNFKGDPKNDSSPNIAKHESDPVSSVVDAYHNEKNYHNFQKTTNGFEAKLPTTSIQVSKSKAQDNQGSTGRVNGKLKRAKGIVASIPLDSSQIRKNKVPVNKSQKQLDFQTKQKNNNLHNTVRYQTNRLPGVVKAYCNQENNPTHQKTTSCSNASYQSLNLPSAPLLSGLLNGTRCLNPEKVQFATDHESQAIPSAPTKMNGRRCSQNSQCVQQADLNESNPALIYQSQSSVTQVKSTINEQSKNSQYYMQSNSADARPINCIQSMSGASKSVGRNQSTLLPPSVYLEPTHTTPSVGHTICKQPSILLSPQHTQCFPHSGQFDRNTGFCQSSMVQKESLRIQPQNAKWQNIQQQGLQEWQGVQRQLEQRNVAQQSHRDQPQEQLRLQLQQCTQQLQQCPQQLQFSQERWPGMQQQPYRCPPPPYSQLHSVQNSSQASEYGAGTIPSHMMACINRQAGLENISSHLSHVENAPTCHLRSGFNTWNSGLNYCNNSVVNQPNSMLPPNITISSSYYQEKYPPSYSFQQNRTQAYYNSSKMEFTDVNCSFSMNPYAANQMERQVENTLGLSQATITQESAAWSNSSKTSSDGSHIDRLRKECIAEFCTFAENAVNNLNY